MREFLIPTFEPPKLASSCGSLNEERMRHLITALDGCDAYAKILPVAIALTSQNRLDRCTRP